MVKAGGTSWFFITADYAFGHALQRDTTSFVTEAGGKVMGSIAYPFPGTTDFSSYLIQAQSSGAKVLGLANAGTDTINTIKQAKEFGLTMEIAALLMFISDVNGLGLEVVIAAKVRAPRQFFLASIRRYGFFASCASAARPFRAEPSRA
jgi:branched-chain amino acid transport system substrate-binding protein